MRLSFSTEHPYARLQVLLTPSSPLPSCALTLVPSRYDMPATFHSRMLQYRITVLACTWRRNVQGNNTHPSGWIYSTETYLHEALLGSRHRTFDPEEADFFYIPVYAACYYW